MFKPIKNLDFIAITLLDISYERLSSLLRGLLANSFEVTFEWISKEATLNIYRIIEDGQTSDGTIARKVGIWPLQDSKDRCVFLSNQRDGAETIINALKLSCDYIRIRTSKYSADRIMNEFEFVHKKQTRIVHSYLDSNKWVFFEKGALMPFENESFYKRRIIKNRVNYEIINEYLEANNWFLNEESFWQSDIATYFIENRNKKMQTTP